MPCSSHRGRRQTVLLSATINAGIQRLASLSLRQPLTVDADDSDSEDLPGDSVKTPAQVKVQCEPISTTCIRKPSTGARSENRIDGDSDSDSAFDFETANLQTQRSTDVDGTPEVDVGASGIEVAPSLSEAPAAHFATPSQLVQQFLVVEVRQRPAALSALLWTLLNRGGRCKVRKIFLLV